jgi:oxygen-independent coproporphyrinogen-3 oxidase
MRVNKNEIPTHRGHIHSEEDRRLRRQILEFMTTGQSELSAGQVTSAQNFLREMLQDGLVELNEQQLVLTEKGKPFLRNACLFFDERLKRQKPQTQVFSKSL